MPAPRVLHVVVGYRLPVYFLNAIRSVRACAPDDDLLVIDNGSEDPGLRDALSLAASGDERIELLLRTTNDLTVNGKVGSLYQAYALAIEHATARGYDLVHLIQADMQMVWWDPAVAVKAWEILAAAPECVNVYTVALAQDRHVSGDIRPATRGWQELAAYGLTDTGLYHLARWRERGLAFAASEAAHADAARRAGLRVICHPWPTVAPIPWPAVMRAGVQRGREVTPRHPLLLRPIGAVEMAAIAEGDRLPSLEDVCIPWGWTCLTPMWPTGVESFDYLVFRARALRQRRWRAVWPRWDRRGVDPLDTAPVQRRPGLAELVGAARRRRR